MQHLQMQISSPTRDDATEEEVVNILSMLWEWTGAPNQPLPSKHKMEQLVGFFRGLERGGYCYISGAELAAIIRKYKGRSLLHDSLQVMLSQNVKDDWSDRQVYEDGRWNYKETPLAAMIFNLHCNPQMFDE